MPDPLDPLFDALESLNKEMTTFNSRLRALEDGAGGLGGPGGPAGADGGRVPGAPVRWEQLETADRTALWQEFTSWVIRLADTYELTTEQLPRDCWWLHGAVVEELTALWTGHQSWANSEGDASAGPYLWHDGLERAISRINRTWLGECTNGSHRTRSRKEFGTDADYRRRVIEAGPPGVVAPRERST